MAIAAPTARAPMAATSVASAVTLLASARDAPVVVAAAAAVAMTDAMAAMSDVTTDATIDAMTDAMIGAMRAAIASATATAMSDAARLGNLFVFLCTHGMSVLTCLCVRCSREYSPAPSH